MPQNGVKAEAHMWSNCANYQDTLALVNLIRPVMSRIDSWIEDSFYRIEDRSKIPCHVCACRFANEYSPSSKVCWFFLVVFFFFLPLFLCYKHEIFFGRNKQTALLRFFCNYCSTTAVTLVPRNSGFIYQYEYFPQWFRKGRNVTSKAGNALDAPHRDLGSQISVFKRTEEHLSELIMSLKTVFTRHTDHHN